jgi:hypothetical protein
MVRALMSPRRTRHCLQLVSNRNLTTGDGIGKLPRAIESGALVFRAISGAILCALTLIVMVACASHSALTAEPVAPTASAAISTPPPVSSENASALAAESRAAASSSSAQAAAAKAAAAQVAAARAAVAKAAAAKAAAAKAAAEKAAAERAAAAKAAADRAAAAQAPAAPASAPPRAQASSPTAAACTPGYSPCIPPGPDVDCAGGSGNGPRYVQGPISVTGSDPYGLDSDHDGIGCEK